jgi:site-specific recombinase XerD
MDDIWRCLAATPDVVIRTGLRHHLASIALRRVKAAGAGLELKAHPQMLRHACGSAFANKGNDTRAIQGWLGYRSIASTAVYTALATNRFKNFGRR